MEDPVYAIFYAEPKQLFYKQILSIDEATHLNRKLLDSEEEWKDGAQGIANGYRPYREITLDTDVESRISTVLSDYFPDLKISSEARFYNHQCGEVKPHTDGNRDGMSQYTLLLYLQDDF